MYSKKSSKVGMTPPFCSISDEEAFLASRFLLFLKPTKGLDLGYEPKGLLFPFSLLFTRLLSLIALAVVLTSRRNPLRLLWVPLTILSK